MALTGRILGWLIFLVAIPLLATDVLVWNDTGIWSPMALGGLWQYLGPRNMVAVQTMIEAYIGPVAWNPVVVTMLTVWAFAAAMALGLGLVALFRRRRHHHRRRTDYRYSALPEVKGREPYRPRYLSRSDERPV